MPVDGDGDVGLSLVDVLGKSIDRYTLKEYPLDVLCCLRQRVRISSQVFLNRAPDDAKSSTHFINEPDRMILAPDGICAACGATVLTLGI